MSGWRIDRGYRPDVDYPKTMETISTAPRNPQMIPIILSAGGADGSTSCLTLSAKSTTVGRNRPITTALGTSPTPPRAMNPKETRTRAVQPAAPAASRIARPTLRAASQNAVRRASVHSGSSNRGGALLVGVSDWVGGGGWLAVIGPFNTLRVAQCIATGSSV